MCLPRLGNNFLSWRLALSNLWYYDIMIIRKRTSQFEIIVKAGICFGLFNFLIPRSVQHLISPYCITLKSNVKAMRIKEMITNLRSS